MRKIAEDYVRYDVVPRLIEAWSKAGIAPGKAVERAEHSPGTPEPSPQENAPATPPRLLTILPSSRIRAALLRDVVQALSGDVAEPAAAPAPGVGDTDGSLDRRPVAEGREEILARFARNGSASQPVPPPPQPRPTPRQAELSDETIDELTESYAAGLLAWNTRRMGPPPDQPGTLVPEAIRRRYGFA